MIKGVNKKIIEINNTDNIYFDKVIFYLKPNVIELPNAVAEAEAEKYIRLLGLDCYNKQYQMLKFRKKLATFTVLSLLFTIGVCVYFLVK